MLQIVKMQLLLRLFWLTELIVLYTFFTGFESFLVIANIHTSRAAGMCALRSRGDARVATTPYGE